jgi:ribokinase
MTRPRIVCLPDFFVDHLVALPELDDALKEVRAVHNRGGGNLQRPQRLVPGGNAANSARALARLGADVHLVARTAPLGLELLRRTLGRDGVRLDRVRDDGTLSLTSALEFGLERRNVMLSDAGALAAYGPHDLTPDDLDLIAGADAVLIGNWSQMRQHGTALHERVLEAARRGRALTYVDTGDPSQRGPDIPAFLERVARNPRLDVLALNENELRHYAGAGEVLDAGADLARHLSATLDLHTAEVAATWGPAGHAVAATHAITPLRTTGAGDTWNAGNLLGHVLRWDPAQRVRFANAAAALYLTNPDGAPPQRGEVDAFLRTPPR